jgi:Ser/Thr protein kinase RdoA (MazF antagonist)
MTNAVPEDDDESGVDWVDGKDPKVLPQALRDAFPALAGEIAIRALSGGLLHQTLHVRTTGGEYVLQRVSDVFSPAIHQNIAAVTSHLAAKGMPSTELVANRAGDLSTPLGADGRWRLMRHLGGVSFESLASLEQARSAGHLVGRFHAAIEDFEGPLAPLGIPYRDTPHYLAALDQTLEAHAAHRLAADITPLGRLVIETFEAWGPAPRVRSRVIHGDLKLSNLLFESRTPPGRDVAFAIIDLDTLMRAPLWVELGDAWRSWCGVDREDLEEIDFDLQIFETSLAGFLEGLGAALSPGEAESLAMAPERIALELCARFVTDALEESYFAWDPARYTSHGDHNADRARRQWSLLRAMETSRSDRAAIVDRLA